MVGSVLTTDTWPWVPVATTDPAATVHCESPTVAEPAPKFDRLYSLPSTCANGVPAAAMTGKAPSVWMVYTISGSCHKKTVTAVPGNTLVFAIHELASWGAPVMS